MELQDLASLVLFQGSWLSGLDSNQDKGLQRALCYRYTTGQDRFNLAVRGDESKEKVAGIGARVHVFVIPQ